MKLMMRNNVRRVAGHLLQHVSTGKQYPVIDTFGREGKVIIDDEGKRLDVSKTLQRTFFIQCK